VEIPERISYSQARSWNTCRYQWRLMYVDHADAVTPPGLRYGAALHEALAAGFRSLLPADVMPGPSTVRDVALDALSDAWDKHDVPWSEGYDEAVEIIERQFRDSIVRGHVVRRDVIAVEEFLKSAVAGVTHDGVIRHATVSAVLDLVLKLPGDLVEIRDHKLGAPRASGGDPQLGLYAALWDAAHPELPVGMVSLSFPTGGELDVRRIDVEPIWPARSVSYVLRARDEIEDAAVHGDTPPNPSVHACSRCDFAHRCPAAVVVALPRARVD